MSKTQQDLLCSDDVRTVVKKFGKELSEEQIAEVLKLYPSEQDADPSGTWNLVVENILYQLQYI